jgi:predicted transcriptional regulator of viral defense system
LCESCSGFVERATLTRVETDEMRPGEVERVVLARARAQHGVISSAQLAEAGASPGWIHHRVERGWLRRLHRGVYLVGPLEAPHARAMAATIAAGRGALLSHYPGAVLWDLRPPGEGPMHVTIVGHDRRSRPGIRTHIVSTLHPSDITRRHGIPVTSAARTLLDLAATAPTQELDRALNEAHLQRRVSPHSLNEQFSRYPHHKGTAALKVLIDNEPKLTRSDAERLMLDLVRKADLPTPETNVRIAGWEGRCPVA